ncbi:MAG: TRAP transporter small permease subunit [Pseudomonadota bacterium]
MLSFCLALDRINQTTARMVKWLAVLMVLITLSVVLLRYLLEVGAIPLQEAVVYLHGLMFMLGIPAGIQGNTHVRVDMIYGRLNRRWQTIIDSTGHVLLLLPLSIFMGVISLPYVKASWQVLEGSAEVGGLPAVFLLKTLIPVTAALMFVQAISELGKNYLRLRGQLDYPEAPKPGEQ